MKILYSIQATGNGHISRGIQLIPYLRQYGQVDIFLSGSNASLEIPLNVAYRSKGISLFYNSCGAIDYKKILLKNHWSALGKEARSLPVEKYDLIINDFEPITSIACHLKKKQSIQLSHQASFRSKYVPRPVHNNLIGESILKWYSTSSSYIGFHFQPYDDFILNPVIKSKILDANPSDKGHITIYHPSYERSFFENHLSQLPEIEFHVFLPGIKESLRFKNCTFHPIDNELFSRSMLSCHGLITGGGFESPSEALYLKKKLMVIPLKNHYEQYCNAAALQAMGVKVLHWNQMPLFIDEIKNWLNQAHETIEITANNIKETIQLVLSKLEKTEPSFDSQESLQWQKEWLNPA
ncbi:MAG: glycosyltransferase family protein [Saprospiraceae bacterium]